MQFDNEVISIIVRTTQEKRLPLLKNAVESILANDYRLLEIIIVAQTTQDVFIEKIQQICHNYSRDRVKVNLVVNQTSLDERTKNLNLGLQNSTGRYLGFLDDDDILYPNHLSSLLEGLKKSGKSWAYSDVASVICNLKNFSEIEKISTSYPFKKNEFLQQEFWQNNFIPIHSYLLDRKKIEAELLYFDESFKVMEDYAFLLKISSRYQPAYVPIITCEYRFFTDASNSNYYINQILGINYAQKAKVWQEATIAIECLKNQLDRAYIPRTRSAIVRKFLLSNFAFLYTMKSKFPRLWNQSLKILEKLQILNDKK
jgi:glycosyltransferase involved in cell wall biosynthesis